MVNAKKSGTKRKWLIKGGVGSALFGFGLCCLLESGFLKHGDSPTIYWVAAGTASLIIVLSGLNILIDAVRLRIQMDE
ncbi:MAG: hypothetical protein LC664_01940 [Flavobacteriales bacterium]|nr:hypothetical protein [Flavobacteriales bacterium]